MHQVDELKTDVNNKAAVAGETQDAPKMSFLPEQQAKVQELIDEAYRKAYSKALRTRTATDEVDGLKEEIKKLRKDRKEAALYRSISRYNVVDADEVAKLLSDRVRLDDGGNVHVIGENGSPRINVSGHPVGLDEYLALWLSERPHHLRAAGATGAGSQGVRFGSGGKASHNLTDHNVWRTMPREDLDRLLKEGVNVYGSAGQVYKFKDVLNPFTEARKKRFKAQRHQ